MMATEPTDEGGTVSTFYEQFKTELDKVTIKADAPAAAVVFECQKAAKRAQMVLDGEEVSPGPFVCEDIGRLPDITFVPSDFLDQLED